MIEDLQTDSEIWTAETRAKILDPREGSQKPRLEDLRMSLIGRE